MIALFAVLTNHHLCLDDCVAMTSNRVRTNATIICRIPSSVDAIAQNTATRREATKIQHFVNRALTFLESVHRPIRVAATLTLDDLLVR